MEFVVVAGYDQSGHIAPEFGPPTAKAGTVMQNFVAELYTAATDTLEEEVAGYTVVKRFQQKYLQRGQKTEPNQHD